MLDCKKMHHKCKAACCGMCPIPADIYNRNLDKIVEQPISTEYARQPDLEDCNGEMAVSKIKSCKEIGYVIPITKSLKCCFLNKDYTCNIYDDRPFLCRKYGDESHHLMSCPWLDKNGKERTRAERRRLDNPKSKFVILP